MQSCDCGRRGAGSPGRGRRALLGAAATAALGCLAAGGVAPTPAARAADPAPRADLTPEQALRLMKEGNDSYRTDAPYRGAQGRELRVRLARGQAPFCVLVGCSDSRVPPELLFGRGLGELFIVRNAGNTVDTAALGSIEYGVGVLGCPLIVVLGHEACGAVAAAVDVVEKNAAFPGVIGEMVQPIIPAVLDARRFGGAPAGDSLLERSIVSNAKRVANRLATQSAVLQGALRERKLKIVPARYDLDDGDVEFFE